MWLSLDTFLKNVSTLDCVVEEIRVFQASARFEYISME